MVSYTYNDGSIPPSGASFGSVTLATNTEFVWPYSYTGENNVISKIMEISCSAGVVMALPSAMEVSTGEDFLVRNIGAELLTIHDNEGVTIGTVDAGAVLALYLKDNTTAAGEWGTIAYGVGTSSIDAATLAGAGLYPIASSLNQEFAVYGVGTGFAVGTTHRAQLVNYTGGVGTITFVPTATLGDGFFVLLRNSGTGTLTLDPNGAELIDGVSSILLQPGESVIIGCNGSALMTVGLGRSTSYQFTQLTKDLTGLGSYTLTPIEASNKLLTFVGSPAAALDVVVPNVVAVYYVYNALSVNHTITVKTAATAGAQVTQGGRAILFCDGTSVFAAQTIAVSGSVPMPDGTAALPGLYFNNEAGTGFYRPSANQLGIAVNGAMSAIFGTSGLITGASGNLSATNLNAALVELQTDIDTRATSSALTTHTGLTAAHGATGAVVGTTNTQTLTNKTLTSPAITAPTGIVKGDVGLGNVDNTSDATKNAAVATLTNKTIVAASNTITTAASGNLVATTLNAALAELQSDIDTRATSSSLITHAGLTATHGVSGAIVGTSDTQTLSGKTIVVANNTITTAASGNLAATNLNAALAELQADIDTRQASGSYQPFDAFYAKISAEQTWTAQQTPMNGTLTDGATIGWNCDSNGQSVSVTLGGNRTLAEATNVNEHACYILRVTQDGTGGRALAWNAAYKFAGGVDPVLSTAIGAVDIFTFVGGGSNVMYCVGQAKGLS